MSISEVNALPELADVYKSLFALVVRYRPGFSRLYDQISASVAELNLDLDEICGPIPETIPRSIEMADRLSREASELLDTGTISREACLVLSVGAYRLVYTSGDAWYVLVDGVLLEGLLEQRVDQLIADVRGPIAIDPLEFLSILELACGHVYAVSATARVLEAKTRLENVVASLVGAGRSDLAAQVRSFTSIYGRLKYWQEVCHNLSNTYLQPTIPVIRSRLLEAAARCGFEVPKEKRAPWELLPYVDDFILPQICGESALTVDRAGAGRAARAESDLGEVMHVRRSC